MNEILVPTGLADLVDQMIILQGKTDAATDPVNRRILAQRLNLMQRIASRVLPQDPSFDDLRRAVVAARRDLMQLEADLRASEVRSDFGVAFVALPGRTCRRNMIWMPASWHWTPARCRRWTRRSRSTFQFPGSPEIPRILIELCL